MGITLVVKSRPERLSLPEAYAAAAVLIGRLAQVHPDFREWWSNPRGPKDAFLPFGDRKGIIARMEEDEEFPELKEKGAPGLLLTNAGDEKTWKKRGRIGWTINPSFGDMRLSIGNPEQAFERPTEIIWGILKELSKVPGVWFAQTNVKQRVGNDLLLYSIDRAPFPHREFLGWMGYVNSPLAAEQVPDAARLERQGNGTLILATEVLDLGNPAAIKQANQVEMSLADLDLLSVIGSSL
ncbi:MULTISPECIES: Imm52 family immunity protein [Gammaproteobacteria]|uniref:Imm52 family immunity protein n=1 Tax=Gammaproteobacteria TaxID=1236 RepID=UPI001126053D|nr:Imm52 family immunity protein [Pseudomonas sp. Hp2]